MKLYKTRLGIVLEADHQFYFLSDLDWDTLVNQDNLYDTLLSYSQTLTASDDYQLWLTTDLLAPLGKQEIWAAGVTYLRSRNARMEESQDAGGGSFYDRVYDAERPEIFFKATPERVAGPLGKVRIRKDSHWNVPEPELTLFITSSEKIVGYTCGNDMSSRDIEGENPLYLPQAKSYDGSAALGPCLYVPSAPIDPGTMIRLTIHRNQTPAFDQQIAISQMKRQHTELVSFLFRECSFAYGCYLMTGTGIVPPDDFTLQSGDEVHIQIDGIGTLINTVA